MTSAREASSGDCPAQRGRRLEVLERETGRRLDPAPALADLTAEYAP